MLKNLIKGEKIKLEDIQAGTAFNVNIACNMASERPDISCFGIDADGKLSDDRYFIFYNQKTSPEGAITAMGASGNYAEVFSIDLQKLPSNIVRLVFTATLENNTDFSKLNSGLFDITQSSTTIASYSFNGADFIAEKAIIIGEIYLKSVWRLATVGQGFNGGLSALLKHFGGEEHASPTPAPPIVPVLATKITPVTPPVSEPKINLSKVRLDKQGSAHKVNLTKSGGQQQFHINLQWDQPTGEAKSGFLGKLFGGNGGGGGVDLDLGCFWLDRNGNRGVIQPLGGNFGSKTKSPYIFLDKDDRSGAAVDGENMQFLKPEEIEKAIIFTFIYEGTSNFSNVNARLNIRDGKDGEIYIPLNNPDTRNSFCAVALIIGDGKSLEFRKEERYFSGHKECDKFYGFGFNWTRGSK